MAQTIAGGHFYKLLEDKGLDMIDVAPPKKHKYRLTDVLEGIKVKKK